MVEYHTVKRNGKDAYQCGGCHRVFYTKKGAQAHYHTHEPTILVDDALELKEAGVFMKNE